MVLDYKSIFGTGCYFAVLLIAVVFFLNLFTLFEMFYFKIHSAIFLKVIL